MNQNQARILAYLDDCSAHLTASHIARALEMSLPSVATNLGHLRSAKLVGRRRIHTGQYAFAHGRMFPISKAVWFTKRRFLENNFYSGGYVAPALSGEM